MILGIGLDVVTLQRFADTVTPALIDRLFVADERERSVARLAGTFAVKEAVIKAFGGIDGFSWHDIHVTHDSAGAPGVVLTGATAALAEARGVTHIFVSISHDEPVAAATVVLEGAQQ